MKRIEKQFYKVTINTKECELDKGSCKMWKNATEICDEKENVAMEEGFEMVTSEHKNKHVCVFVQPNLSHQRCWKHINKPISAEHHHLIKFCTSAHCVMWFLGPIPMLSKCIWRCMLKIHPNLVYSVSKILSLKSIWWCTWRQILNVKRKKLAVQAVQHLLHPANPLWWRFHCFKTAPPVPPWDHCCTDSI